MLANARDALVRERHTLLLFSVLAGATDGPRNRKFFSMLRTSAKGFLLSAGVD